MVEITDTKRLVQTECVAKDSFSVQFNSIYRMNLLYGEGEEDRSRICGTVQNGANLASVLSTIFVVGKGNKCAILSAVFNHKLWYLFQRSYKYSGHILGQITGLSK